jgi:hypothetical protein
MNLTKRFALSLATLLGFAAVGARAETIVKGTFTLPAPAYWNTTLLQPGEYNLSVDRSNSGHNMIFLRGQGIAAIFVTPAGSEDTSGHSCLKVDDVNGTNVIREFDAGPAGRAYRFGVSKTVRDLNLRSATRSITVPITAAE